MSGPSLPFVIEAPLRGARDPLIAGGGPSRKGGLRGLNEPDLEPWHGCRRLVECPFHGLLLVTASGSSLLQVPRREMRLLAEQSC